MDTIRKMSPGWERTPTGVTFVLPREAAFRAVGNARTCIHALFMGDDGSMYPACIDDIGHARVVVDISNRRVHIIDGESGVCVFGFGGNVKVSEVVIRPNFTTREWEDLIHSAQESTAQLGAGGEYEINQWPALVWVVQGVKFSQDPSCLSATAKTGAESVVVPFVEVGSVVLSRGTCFCAKPMKQYFQ